MLTNQKATSNTHGANNHGKNLRQIADY